MSGAQNRAFYLIFYPLIALLFFRLYVMFNRTYFHINGMLLYLKKRLFISNFILLKFFHTAAWPKNEISFPVYDFFFSEKRLNKKFYAFSV